MEKQDFDGENASKTIQMYRRQGSLKSLCRVRDMARSRANKTSTSDGYQSMLALAQEIDKMIDEETNG